MAVTIAHLSDLHFGMKSQTESWRPLTNFLANELRPDLVLVTGDLADSAQAPMATQTPPLVATSNSSTLSGV